MLPLAASADVTFDVIFTGTTTGTITYAAANDLEPTSYSFTHGATTWATGDCLPIGPFDTAWSAGAPAFFAQTTHAMNVVDCASPPATPTNVTLSLGDTGAYIVMGAPPPDDGFYSFQLSEPVSTPALHPLGIALLGSVLGVAGWRRLRA